jgi:hypothetical protein
MGVHLPSPDWRWLISSPLLRAQQVAGYNPINEPADPSHTALQAFYSRVEKAIREVDPHHILFLDGNTYAADFSAFKDILPNCVYAIHDYASMGFPAGQPYTGTEDQKEALQRSYERKVEFMRRHKVPVSPFLHFAPLRSSQVPVCTTAGVRADESLFENL